MLFAAVHESAFGTKRTFAAPQNLSAIGVTADKDGFWLEMARSRIDPFPRNVFCNDTANGFFIGMGKMERADVGHAALARFRSWASISTIGTSKRRL
jgi:hypothetical protein